MTSIEKLISDVKKKCNYNIIDNIIIEQLNNSNSKILISDFYEECLDSNFGNVNKILPPTANMIAKIIRINNVNNLMFLDNFFETIPLHHFNKKYKNEGRTIQEIKKNKNINCKIMIYQLKH